MVDKNKELFRACQCDIFEVRTILDLENCDALVFPSSISSSLLHYIWQWFLDHILEKNKNKNFPVWTMWQSFSLLENQFDLKLIWKNISFEEEIVLDFLDVKPFQLKFFQSFSFEQKNKWYQFFSKKTEIITIDKNSNPCIFRNWKLFVTTFSPELSEDKRIYEYFMNEFID